MDIFVTVLIALHFLGLAIGAASVVAFGVVMARIGPTKDGERARLFSIGDTLVRYGHIALGLLWVTGILLVVFAYGGVGGLGAWFWVKLVIVVALSASMGMGSAAYRKFKADDMGASGRVAVTNAVNMVAGVLIILFAVMAFS